ncbi:MAG: hypothetical protein QOE28_404 [Solirubrobacteraceae bacterium]|jgi:hypothetical protein|nr:hypothetical protein [Solirubrobacteraceae bacterium]
MTQTTIGHLDERRMHGVLQRFAREHELSFGSCLDIGCGRSRYDRWFDRFDRAEEPRRYIGLETDEVIIEELQREGVDVRHALDAPGDCRSDLTLCIEVIEHLKPSETPGFLSFVEKNTERVMMLTTPNFEYWEGKRPRPEYRECRWIPDHLPTFNPAGGPHHHKQAMTPQNLSDYLATAFPAPEWSFEVFRAWPWRLEDLTTSEAFHLYFKLYAIAWRTVPKAAA